MEKMSLEKFYEIKEQLMEMKPDIDKLWGEKQRDLIKKHIAIQVDLLSYDLSDIPFEAWEGMTIYSSFGCRMDFSYSKANIDFKLIRFKSLTQNNYCDFHSCNVKNIYYYYKYNEEIFDEEVINNNKELFLPQDFEKDFKERFYDEELTLHDIDDISYEEFDRLLEIEKLDEHFSNEWASSFPVLSLLEFKNALTYYKKHMYELEAVDNVVSNLDYNALGGALFDTLQKCELKDVKDIIFDYARERIFSDEKPPFQYFGDAFREENADLYYWLEIELPSDIINRFRHRELLIEGIINHFDSLKNIPLDYFIHFNSSSYFLQSILENNGPGYINKVLKDHIDFFKYLEKNKDFNVFSNIFNRDYIRNEKNEIDIEKSLTDAAIKFYLSEKNERIGSNIPKHMESFNIKLVSKIETNDDFKNLDYNVLVRDLKQRKTLNIIGLQFIKELDKESGLFSSNPTNSNEPLLLNSLCQYMHNQERKNLLYRYTGFKHNDTEKKEKLKRFACILDEMESNGYFKNLEDSNYYKKIFDKKYPNILISDKLSKDFRKKYYDDDLEFEDFVGKEELIPYLEKLDIYPSISSYIEVKNSSNDFLYIYKNQFGTKKTLELLCKYGYFLSDIEIDMKEINLCNEDETLKYIRKLIANLIIKGEDRADYHNLYKIPEMVKEYPGLFIDTSSLNMSEKSKKKSEENFYKYGFTYDDIRNKPELIKALSKTDLNQAFRRQKDTFTYNYHDITLNDNELADFIGKDNFLNLCIKYGYLMDNIYYRIFKHFADNTKDNYSNTAFKNWLKNKFQEDIISLIETTIYKSIQYGEVSIPDFMEKDYPEFVYEGESNILLNNAFVRGLSLEELYRNKEKFLELLKGKSVMTAILRYQRRFTGYYKEWVNYFKTFGEKDGIKLLMNKYETVILMVQNGRIDTAWKWFCKSGKRFLPDVAVMNTFSIEESDIFFKNASIWRELNKSDEFDFLAYKEKLLKLAIIFGAFDNDTKGIKKLKDLIYKIPSKGEYDFSMFLENASEIEMNYFEDAYKGFDKKTLDSLENIKNMIIKEGIPFDKKGTIISQLYKRNSDDSYSLVFNQNGREELTIELRKMLRMLLDDYTRKCTFPLCYTPRALTFIEGLEAKYNPKFRDFIIENMNELVTNPDKSCYLPEIQKKFPAIMAYNCNRKLTLQSAINFVEALEYPNIDVGNERLSKISSITGYSNDDFTTLQDIYNLGKQRIYSTIPRIENSITINNNTYHYELLRLDDPLILAIGTLTDCCQEIDNHAQVTMEQSMVENNTRIFVIKDEEGNFVAQSWVWRNKDVLCFDNVEIPEKAFSRFRKKNPNKKEKDFHNEIYDVYEKASKEIMEIDNNKYKELLDKKEITKEDYNTLRIGLITIGDGNNDLVSLYDKSKGTALNSLRAPIYETQFFKGTDYTRLFSDASWQYVVEEREDREKTDNDAKPVYTDTYEEYTDETLDTTSLLLLKGLEYNDDRYYNSISNVKFEKEGKYVTELARIYGTEPSKTKVVMNPNFGIIYEDNDDTITIVDIVYNLKVKEKEETISIEKVVLKQIKLALEQIGKDKKIVLDDLDEDSEKLYKKVESL